MNAQGTDNAARQDIFPRLARDLEGLAAPLEQIGEPYRSAGRLLADWIAGRYRPGEPLPVVVVCTGNSRRSMLGAMMGNAAAAFIGLPEVRFFSAGTTPSAFNPRTIATLRAIGFEIEPTGDEAREGQTGSPTRATASAGAPGRVRNSSKFSKALGDPSLPESGFAAVMVCDEADAGCPIVPGAAIRISMPFPDPKTADDTPREGEQYAATRDALGRIMLAVLERGLGPDRCSLKKNQQEMGEWIMAADVSNPAIPEVLPSRRGRSG